MVATLKTVSCTIPAGQTMSDAADCRGSIRILRVLMPSDWTRAPLSFRLSTDGVEWGDLYHTTEQGFTPFEVVVPEMVPGSVVTLPVNMSSTVAFVRVRSGAHVAQVPQAAARVFKFILEMPEAPEAGPTGSAGPAGPTGATGPSPVLAAATGPTGGNLQTSNIVHNWGTVVASTAGVDVTFQRPYVNDIPSVTTGGQAGGVLQIVPTKTGFNIKCNAGSPTVYWHAIGS